MGKARGAGVVARRTFLDGLGARPDSGAVAVDLLPRAAREPCPLALAGRVSGRGGLCESE